MKEIIRIKCTTSYTAVALFNNENNTDFVLRSLYCYKKKKDAPKLYFNAVPIASNKYDIIYNLTLVVRYGPRKRLLVSIPGLVYIQTVTREYTVHEVVRNLSQTLFPDTPTTFSHRVIETRWKSPCLGLPLKPGKLNNF